MMKKTLSAALLSLFVLLLPFGNCFASQQNASLALMYHRLSENENELGEYTTTPQDFEEDIKYLISSGYTVCSAGAAAELMSGCDKVCVITFDDGYESDFAYALPIIEKYNVGATFFIIGSYVGEDGYMTRDMLRKLASSENAEIGNHSYFCHLFSFEEINKFQTLYPSSYVNDFLKNSSFLENICGRKITSLSYPYGAYTAHLNKLFANLGYTAFSSAEAAITPGASPIPRFNRSNTLSAKDIIEKKINAAAPTAHVGYSPIKNFF